MQNSLWKLTALAGVVGIGSLVVLQAQRGLTRPADQVASAEADAPADTQGSDAEPLFASDPGAREDSTNPADETSVPRRTRAAASNEYDPDADARPVRRRPAEPDPFDGGSGGNAEPAEGAPRPAAKSDSVDFGEETPPPRRSVGLDFRDDAGPTPTPVKPRAAAGQEPTPVDNPFGGSEPTPAPRGTTPRDRGNVTTAGAEVPADEPELRPTADPTRGGEPSEPTSPGPQLFGPSDVARPAESKAQPQPETRSADSDPNYFGDDLPSRPSPRPTTPRPDPFGDSPVPVRPRAGANSAPETELPMADSPAPDELPVRTPRGVKFDDEPASGRVTPAAGDDIDAGAPRRPAPRPTRATDPDASRGEPQRFPDLAAETEPMSPARSGGSRDSFEAPPSKTEPDLDLPPRTPLSGRASEPSAEPERPSSPELDVKPRGAIPERSAPPGNSDRSSDVDPLRPTPSERSPLDRADREPAPTERPGARPAFDNNAEDRPATMPEPIPDRSIPDRSPRPRSLPDRTAPDFSAEPTLPARTPLGRDPLPRSRTEPDATAPRRTEPRRTTPLDASSIDPHESAAEHAGGVRARPRGDGIVGTDSPKGPQKPQLKIEKVAPPNAVLGQPLVYDIRIRNVGDTAAQDVVVEDRIPKGSELIGSIPQAELVDKTLHWKLGTMQPGEEKTLSIKVKPLSEGQIGSIATVNFVAEVASKTMITAPKLQLDLIGPKQARTGEAIPYVFKVRNAGTADAKGVIIRDIVPEGLKHADGNDLEYELGTLPAGATREVRLTLTAIKMGEATNRAVATADGATVEATSNVEVLGPSLSITRTGPKRMYVGRNAQFTTTVANDSSHTINGATVVEAVPEGMDVIETANGFYNRERRTISWRIDRLMPQQKAELIVKLRPRSSGAKSTTVRAMEGAGAVSEVTAQTEVIGVANLDADVSGPAANLGLGEQMTFRVVVRNRGNDAASNVRLKLDIPEEMQFVSADGRAQASADGREVAFPALPRLDAERETAFNVVLRAVRPGNARMTLAYEADDMPRPLTRDEQIVILQDGEASAVSSPRR